MTNLVVEGFATYGLGSVLDTGVIDRQQSPVAKAMLSGAWADCRRIITVPAPSLGVLPFGTDEAIYYGGPSTPNQIGDPGFELRRVVPVPADELIVSLRFAAATLPTIGGVCGICALRNGSNATVALLVLQPSGQLALYQKGTELPGPSRVLLLQTQTPVIVAESAQHIEFMIAPAAGTFELYVDGNQVMDGTGLTFGAAGPIALIAFNTSDANSQQFSDNAVIYFTDLIIRDTEGTTNNEIMGDRRVATLMVNRDDDDFQGWTPFPLQRFGTGILDNSRASNNSGVVTAAPTTETDLGDGDFTIEGQFRFSALPSSSNRATLFGKWDTAGNQRSYLAFLGGPLLDSGMFAFQCSTDGLSGTVETLIRWPWEPQVGRWYHVAISRKTGVLRFFVDGVQQGTDVADVREYFAGAARTCLGGLYIDTGNVVDYSLDGWVDEFRLTQGVGRYDANFTPPTAEFPRSALGDPDWADVTWLSGFDSGLFDDSSFGRTLLATSLTGPNDPPPVMQTPDDKDAAYKTLNKRSPPLDDTFIQAALLPATGLLTISALPLNAQVVRVGTEDGTDPAIYTFKTVLATAYDVLIGASESDSLNNLVAAINGAAGEGTLYGTGTLANFDVTAVRMPTLQVMAIANTAGAVGNAIVTTETLTNGAWAAGTLQGGADIPGPSQFGFERPPNNTTVVDSITLVQRAWKTDSGPATVVQAFVGPGGAKTDGDPHALSTTPTLYFDTFEIDPDTAAPITPTTVVSGKTRVNRTV